MAHSTCISRSFSDFWNYAQADWRASRVQRLQSAWLIRFDASENWGKICAAFCTRLQAIVQLDKNSELAINCYTTTKAALLCMECCMRVGIEVGWVLHNATGSFCHISSYYAKVQQEENFAEELAYVDGCLSGDDFRRQWGQLSHIERLQILQNQTCQHIQG